MGLQMMPTPITAPVMQTGNTQVGLHKNRRSELALGAMIADRAPASRQAADPDHILLSEPVAAACTAERGLPPPPVRAIAAKGKPAGVRCARFAWRSGAFVDRDWPPPPPPTTPPTSNCASPVQAAGHRPPEASSCTSSSTVEMEAIAAAAV